MAGKRVESLMSLLGVALFAASVWVLYHTVGAFRPIEVRAALDAVPAHRVALALGLTAAGYWVLTLTDALAFRYIGRPTPYRQVALPAFTGYGFSQSVGVSVLTGVGVRYRIYGAWGVTAAQVASMVAFLALTAWVGLLALAGAAFTLAPPAPPAELHLPPGAVRPLGVAFLLAVGVYLWWVARRGRPLRLGGREVPVPSPAMAVEQVVLSAVRWALAAATLAALLPPGAGVGYVELLGVFLLAEVAGRLSHVPGGLGVLETVVLVLLTPQVAAPHALGALLLYRLIYYLIPLGAAVALLGAHEVRERRGALRGSAEALGPWLPRAVLRLLGVAALVSGAWLMVTGTLPMPPPRLALLVAALVAGGVFAVAGALAPEERPHRR